MKKTFVFVLCLCLSVSVHAAKEESVPVCKTTKGQTVDCKKDENIWKNGGTMTYSREDGIGSIFEYEKGKPRRLIKYPSKALIVGFETLFDNDGRKRSFIIFDAKQERKLEVYRQGGEALWLKADRREYDVDVTCFTAEGHEKKWSLEKNASLRVLLASLQDVCP